MSDDNTNIIGTRFFVGFILGAGFIMVLESNLSTTSRYKAAVAKEICEISLPRDQTCKVIIEAEPVKENKYIDTKPEQE